MANLADQNNNPGNLKDFNTGQFKRFNNSQEGYSALLNDLQGKVSGKSATGINGSSTLYDFSKTWAPASDKNNPAKYAADLANTLGVRPDTPIGDLQSRLGDFAQAIARNEGYTQAKSFAATSTHQPNTASNNNESNVINTAYASGSQPAGKKGFVSKALGVAGKALDMFLPTLGDVKNIFEGDNKKTKKQLLGDLALSAISFVPGLGEAGALGKAAEGAGALAKVARGVKAVAPLAEGYGVGVAQNLAEGKGFGESIKPGFANIGGAALGGLTHGLIKKGGNFLEGVSGIPENIKPVLSGLSNPNHYDEYINAAKARATDVRNSSPLELAADYTKKAATGIQQKLKQVGKMVGEVKKTEGAKKLASVDPVLGNFVTKLEDKFGLKISTNKFGKGIKIENAAGRMKNVLTSADQNRVKRALSEVLQLRKSGNIRKASDVIDNLDALVDYSKKDLLGHSNDPLEGFLKSVRHDLNEVVRESSPTLAQAKARFHDLSDSLGEITGAGGDNLQRAELLLKRVLAGDKSEASRKVFDIIKKETGIDLVEHAVLADHSIRTIKDPSQVSLLNKMIENVVQEGQPTAFSTGLNLGKGILRKTFSNPEKIGRNLANKKGPGIIQGLLKKNAVRGAARIPGLISP